ncbi:4-azaleucine resistance transporter AzlC [Natranaerovirga hydrolytica]|uniref:4-azaleucine resistance transporter AzlC n=1 Tax=Natranaerovirga hydrolytica TaxID=680378 RepID=A0A4V2PZ05_9FIRM|nr:AzlC family ABC transporter permease [Natranaerovirga hydrolytica]TCK87971.1 4-azaleucine resistance transporter AzlC [Natranaerovirga hydrolytica]
MKTKKKEFMSGMKVGLPIAIGYIPIAITFGLIIRTSELPLYTGILMSLFVFAGASQFIGANLMMHGANMLEIVFTTFILNFRHFLMSTSLSQRITFNTSKKLLSLISFGITDETFAIASVQKEKSTPFKLLGLNTIAYTSWNVGTWVGLIVGGALPTVLINSLGIALYAMFIGLLIPNFKRSKEVIVIALIAIAISSILYWIPLFGFVSDGWRIILSTTVAAFIGANAFEMEVEQ